MSQEQAALNANSMYNLISQYLTGVNNEKITQEEFKKITGEIFTGSEDYVYEGFQSEEIMKQLKMKHTEFAFEKESYFKTIVEMITLFLMRGTKVTKMSKKMSDKGNAKLTKLVNIYKLQDRVGSSSSRKTITLGRVAATFPTPTISVAMHLGTGLRVLPGFNNCPIAQLGAWVSFIEVKNEWDIAYVCAYKTNLIINAKARGQKDSVRQGQVLPYINIIRRNSGYDKTVKAEVNFNLGFYVFKDPSNKASPELKQSDDLLNLHKEVTEWAAEHNVKIPAMDAVAVVNISVEQLRKYCRRLDGWDPSLYMRTQANTLNRPSFNPCQQICELEPVEQTPKKKGRIKI
jgi:hypothetical protein